MNRAIFLSVLLLSGCALFEKKLVTEKEKVECRVEPAAVAPVAAPPKLVAPAYNEDLWNRAAALEGALEICNARLVAVPKIINTNPAKPPEAPKPGLWDRLRNVF